MIRAHCLDHFDIRRLYLFSQHLRYQRVQRKLREIGGVIKKAIKGRIVDMMRIN